MTPGFALLTALLMLAISFFFSGIEIAFLSANNLKIEVKKQQGRRSAIILSELKKKTSRVHPAILIGNTIALVIFTQQIDALLTAPLENLLQFSKAENYLLFTAILSIFGTIIILIFAEYIPKAIFKGLADRVVFPSAFLLLFAYKILQPIVWLINTVSRFILRYVLGVKNLTESQVLSKQDLDLYIRKAVASSGEETELNDLDTEMLHNALEFKETRAREFMIPRTKIEAASIDTPVDDLGKLFIETQLSKIIIYGENLDDIKGFVHSRSLFAKPKSIQEIVQGVLIVPETMPADMLLVEFNENKKSVAIVVDEFGGTEGMITMEDLVEEVFGEIEDEYDEPEFEEDLQIKRNSDGSFLLGARLEIDNLIEELKLDLPEDESYSTLGGLFTFMAEDIPQQGESIMVGNYKLTAVKAEQNRIILINLALIDGN
jgi:putative hemolysin